MRGAWIEIGSYSDEGEGGESLPMRGAWIEICLISSFAYSLMVAPHAGSVD